MLLLLFAFALQFTFFFAIPNAGFTCDFILAFCSHSLYTAIRVHFMLFQMMATIETHLAERVPFKAFKSVKIHFESVAKIWK